MNSVTKCRKSAFTLIELLVVIAIIAILAAILFPVFATAREKARQTSCASNEKQMGIAFLQYEQDFDESFPAAPYSAICGITSTSCGVGWAGRLYPYVKSTGAYACMDDTTKPGAGAEIVSYGYNDNLALGGASTADPKLAGPAVSVLTAPTLTVMLYEWSQSPFDVTNPNETGSSATNGDNERSGTSGSLATGTLSNAGGANWYITARHSGNSNFLMCDGHVKWLPAGMVSAGYCALSTTSVQDFTNGWIYNAAGTGNGSYAATFSPL